ncbi:MAG: hypothetical protein FJ030_15885 [Chloroflexi bacterium]|nr:hypothetical protein [Chloroflexota bacterium]
MEVLTQTQIIFLKKIVAAYERERQLDHPAYLQARQQLARALTAPPSAWDGSQARPGVPQTLGRFLEEQRLASGQQSVVRHSPRLMY